MPVGIRATVGFPTPRGCPIAELSRDAEAAVETMNSTVSSDGARGSTSEFLMTTEADPGDDVTQVFSYGSMALYRIHHGDGPLCPCECLGKFGCPVSSYTARNGDLTIVFHTQGYDELIAVTDELRGRFPEMDLKRFIRSPTSDRTDDSVFVDRGRLTDRQLEVLRTAYEVGYFEKPRGTNASEIADTLGISASTFSEHLATAQRKIFRGVLDTE